MDSFGNRPRVGPFLTLRGSGEFNGFEWQFHADVKGGDIYDYLYVGDAVGHSGGMGGGGVGGPEPGVLSPQNRNKIVSTGFQDSAQGVPKKGQRLQPNAVCGAVSSPDARVIVELSDGTAAEATMLQSGEKNLRYFVHVFSSGLKVERLVALDTAGNELEGP